MSKMNHRSPYGTGWRGTLRRWLCGARSLLTTAVFPLGRWWRPGAARLLTPQRFDCGWTIILPGIVGHSTLNENLARGLRDAGIETAIEVVDWTGGWLLLFPYYLRRERGNRLAAERIAQRIIAYQDRHPGRPVHLIGHSGGAGIALWVLEHLPPDRRITSVVLIAAAISQTCDARPLLPKTERGLWNFYSPMDVFFLSLLMLAAGTMDGRHAVAAGLTGFVGGPEDPPDNGDAPRLHQIRYHPGMARQFHWGGHFGYTNEVFAAENIAPILRGEDG